MCKYSTAKQANGQVRLNRHSRIQYLLSGEERCPRIVAHEHNASTRACELFDEVVHGAGEVCGAEVGACVDERGEAAGDEGLETLQSGGRRIGHEAIEGGLVWAFGHEVAQVGQPAQIWGKRVVFGGSWRTRSKVIAQGVDQYDDDTIKSWFDIAKCFVGDRMIKWLVRGAD